MTPLDIAWNFLKADFTDPSVRELTEQIASIYQHPDLRTDITEEELREVQEMEAAEIERALADEDVRQSIPPEEMYEGGTIQRWHGYTEPLGFGHSAPLSDFRSPNYNFKLRPPPPKYVEGPPPRRVLWGGN